MSTILRNMAKCLKCNDIVESLHRHDFRTCKCGNITVDGGTKYIRRVGKDLEQMQELSVKTDGEGVA